MHTTKGRFNSLHIKIGWHILIMNFNPVAVRKPQKQPTLIWATSRFQHILNPTGHKNLDADKYNTESVLTSGLPEHTDPWSASPRSKPNPKSFLARQLLSKMWKSLGIFQGCSHQADPPAQALQNRQRVHPACCSLPHRVIPERRGMASSCREAMQYLFAAVASMFLLATEAFLPVDGRHRWTE